MRRNRRVKIIATLGPASSDKETIKKLFIAGADVFRINMSHASTETLSELHRTIRKVEAESGRPIGILVDLQGPKLRVGEFASGSVELVEGSSFTFDRDEKPGSTDRVYLPHPEIFEAVEPGHSLILDDGKRRLNITDVAKEAITAKVIVGGPLASRKGISLPDTILPFGAMTEKDRHNLEHAINLGADWIGLSFVQRGRGCGRSTKADPGTHGDHDKGRKAVGDKSPRADY